MAQYQYQPLPDSKSFIRLLTLSSVNDEITYTLSDFPIDSAPTFHAVSYCWGTDPATEKIHVGQELAWIALTPHLLEGIQCLYATTKPERLWIDAICINQVDHVEKEGQIPLMGRIYSEAEMVLVWLGPGTEESELAMRLLPNFIRKLTELPTQDYHESAWRKEDLPLLNDAVWSGIVHMFTSVWYKRLWPIQEVVLARDVLFFCGKAHVSIMRFSLLAQWCMNNVNALIHLCKKGSVFQQASAAVAAIAQLSLFREDRKNRDDDTLFLLRYGRSKAATKPIDHVYALLGLCSDRVRSRIVVDYSEENEGKAWRIYLNIGQVLFSGNAHEFLAIAESKLELPELPSWCPNWSCPELSLAFPLPFETGLIHRGTGFKTSDTLILHGGVVYGLGFEFDKIDQLVSLSTVAYINNTKCLELMGPCERLAYQTAPDGSRDRTREIARTFIANCLLGPNPTRYDDELLLKDFAATKKCLMVSPPALGTDTTSDEDLFAADRYRRSFSMMWRNRCFFVTKRGFLGLGSSRCQVGDTACVLFGGEYPYIMRQRPDGVTYKLIAPAYIDGIMDGESLTSRDPGMDRIFAIS